VSRSRLVCFKLFKILIESGIKDISEIWACFDKTKEEWELQN
jgi:hypothetical protein